MSAPARLEPLTLAHLDALMAIEGEAYAQPWTRGNFLDSINAGYHCQALMAGQQMLGYFIAMMGVQEAHLLNITVAPACRGQGCARLMLQALGLWARGCGAQTLWLEVRVGNARARAVYAACGFHGVGLRRNYYPAGAGQREDAVVMCLTL
ncbi:ribosomal protein S18-alanine N-acetyltransferase [Comamonas sp. NLF-1-9]|uniref:ribosomal protein S18-alanine N-acetyltransferase n=1 Tax=Comamonas sp. NLF-1-9 TaxID=2853163 RepID=UPI001C44E54C|nr:ribosomal protein S18-alanine N-acetyltransferase [Comamonas sp. NLF-1-9]QXL83830.1 ribosomal protein S18-alanine N-acetyltransferase [Comamonas sp. NLF-1-9]